MRNNTSITSAISAILGCDIKVGINSLVSVFDDDTKLSRVISSQQDIATLQDLSKIKWWATM